jgi:hypothetical protein
MPLRVFQRKTARSPNLGLAADFNKEQTLHPQVAGDSGCPFQLAACGYNFDQPKQVFRESLAAIDELVIWRYVVAGSFLWDTGNTQLRLGAGSVLMTRQPSPKRLVIACEGACMLWVLCVGKPALDYCDQIAARFGRTQFLPATSEPIRRAEELVRLVRSKRPRSPFSGPSTPISG